MIRRHIVVLGAGVSGLAASVLLARDGHRVTLIEGDPVSASAPEAAFEWERNGIAHFLQPHAFIPRGRKELIEMMKTTPRPAPRPSWEDMMSLTQSALAT